LRKIISHQADTIAAISTATGVAAVGMVRVSGPDSLKILGQCFRDGGRDAVSAHALMRHGWIVDEQQQPLDEVLAVAFLAPRSYTGEDMIEIHCHGGEVVMQLVLQRVLECGARLAGAGEFTRRAYLNGKLSLDRVEAIMQLIEARDRVRAKAAAKMLSGRLGRRLEEMAALVRQVQVDCEAAIEFPDDVDTDGSVGKRLEDARRLAGEMLGQVRVQAPGSLDLVLSGPVNAGKSTLANELAGRDISIVTGQAGTTRDAVCAPVSLGGYSLSLVDTAGLSEQARDEIDEVAMRVARARISAATVVVWISEVGCLVEPPGGVAADLKVMNKQDLATDRDCDEARARGWIPISAKFGQGLERLRERIEQVLHRKLGPADGMPLSARQAAGLRRMADGLARAGGLLEDGLVELAVEECRQVLDMTEQIGGQARDEEVLEEIFSRFCVGK